MCIRDSYRIPPEKSPPADNLPVKIRPARAAAGRGKVLPVNCRPGETFLEGDPIKWDTSEFCGPDDELL